MPKIFLIHEMKIPLALASSTYNRCVPMLRVLRNQSVNTHTHQSLTHQSHVMLHKYF